MINRYKQNHLWKNVDKTVREVKRLLADRHYRDSRNAFFVEGVRNFVQVVDHKFEIEVILYSEKLLTAPLARKFVRQCRRSGTKTVNLSPENFRKLSSAERASGIAAVVYQRWQPLKTADPDQGLCWVVLSHVRSAGNFGTLIRTSEAIGGAGFILLGHDVDPYSPLAVRASMGSLFRQRFIRTEQNAFKRWIKTHQAQLIGASAEGSADFHQFEYPQTPLIFLGEERQGLSPKQKAMCDHLVRIPMVGQADSLNLGVAGSLLMYELYRGKWLELD